MYRKHPDLSEGLLLMEMQTAVLLWMKMEIGLTAIRSLQHLLSR